MILTNWEFFDSGNPVVGATVRVRDAVVSHPNTGTVLSSTTTDSNGMWTFTGLSATAKDVEVIWGASGQYHKWYKGMTQHGVATSFFDTGLSLRGQSSSLAAPGAGETVLWANTGGTLLKRSGAAGAVSTVADFDGAGSNNVLRSTGWGQVATADIVANAVTEGSFIGTGAVFSTTSTTPVAVTGSPATLSLSNALLLYLCTGTIANNTNNGLTVAQALVNGASAGQYSVYQAYVAGAVSPFALALLLGPYNGSFTFALGVNAGAGTTGSVGPWAQSLIVIKK